MRGVKPPPAGILPAISSSDRRGVQLRRAIALPVLKPLRWSVSFAVTSVVVKRFIGVADSREIKPVWWCESSAGTSVASIQYRANLAGTPVTRTDAHQRAHNAPDLSVKKAAGSRLDLHLPPSGNRYFADRQFIQRMTGGIRLANRRAKSRKVVLADQECCRFSHPFNGQRCAELPDSSPVQGRW